MKNPIQPSTAIDPIRNSLNRSPWRSGYLRLAIILTALSFALSPTARAVDPPPDGGYPNANTAEGDQALFSLTSGNKNTATGFEALETNTTGDSNTAVGADALLFSTGNNNTGVGVSVLASTTGNDNTAVGVRALNSNTTGGRNVAIGESALLSNQTGNENTASGWNALNRNSSGGDDAATGAYALYSNTGGSYNTANGVRALYGNLTGSLNTADGNRALYNNTTGFSNTASGLDSLYTNTTGANNIALGSEAGFNLTTGNNNIEIGNPGNAGEAATIRIGTNGTQTNTYIAGISGVTVAGGVGVMIDSNGHLGTITCSARFKDSIKPMDKTSEAILALKPVTFRYKHELDPDGIPQFGLVAEQVEKVNPDLVARDDQGKAYTVRYEAVNAMLLNEFLKEHRKVEDLKTTTVQLRNIFDSTLAQQRQDFESALAAQQKQIQALTATLKERASQIQKVSDQLEVVRSLPHLVASDH